MVVPHFAPAGESAFESRYAEPSLDSRDVGYLAALLFRSCCCRSPPRWLPSRRSLRSGSTCSRRQPRRPPSSRTTQRSRLPALLAAAVFGTSRLGGRTAYLVAARARRDVLLGPIGRVEVHADEHDAAARRALALIPPGPAVSATNSLGAHLSARKRIFSFPVLEEAEWVAVDERRLTYLDSLEARPCARAARRARRDPRFRRVFAEDGMLVFRRRLEGIVCGSR